MKGFIITPLKSIDTEKGKILHALKSSENTFKGFGEAYFSFVHQKQIKGWKKHTRMQLNLIVPVGSIEFVAYDDREGSATYGSFQSVILNAEMNHARLTVDPGLWLAFRGIENENCLLNIASIEHDPDEATNKALDEIIYDWHR